MKNRIYAQPPVVLALMVFCSRIAPVLLAQNPAAVASQPAPVQLPAHVGDVLRLAHGDVSEGIIIAYIRNSGRLYSLGASEILYLHEQGVSDPVLTAMLNQRQNEAATAALAVPHATPTAQPAVWANESSPQYVLAATQSARNYVERAPVYSQPAPLYVYPPTYGYYDYWPYFGGSWGDPWLSFSFGYWGGYYGGHPRYYGRSHRGVYYGGNPRGGYYAGGRHPGGGYPGGGNHGSYSGGARGPGYPGAGRPGGSPGVGRPGGYSGGGGPVGYSGAGRSFGAPGGGRPTAFSGGSGRAGGFSGGGRSGGFSGGGRPGGGGGGRR